MWIWTIKRVAPDNPKPPLQLFPPFAAGPDATFTTARSCAETCIIATIYYSNPTFLLTPATTSVTYLSNLHASSNEHAI